MKQSPQPFRLPRELAPDLARIEAYWRGLLRGSAEMPFADDLDLTVLPDLKPRLMVMEVFTEPDRFRFDIVGEDIEAAEIVGRFADEIAPKAPLDFLRAQASATLESASPTFFDQDEGASSSGRGYARLLLPMWGDGRIKLILGAIVWH